MVGCGSGGVRYWWGALVVSAVGYCCGVVSLRWWCASSALGQLV